MIKFKSIYTHQDGYDVDIISVDYERFPNFVYVQEDVWLDEDTVSSVESIYDLNGMFITESVAIMEQLVTLNVCEYEGVMCPRLAVIGRISGTDTYVTWSKGYIKEFGIGYKPSYADPDHYLPTSIKDSVDFLRSSITAISMDEYTVGPKHTDSGYMFCTFHASNLGKPVHTCCDVYLVFGTSKYEALTREDTKKWAVESTHAQPITLTLI